MRKDVLEIILLFLFSSLVIAQGQTSTNPRKVRTEAEKIVEQMRGFSIHLQAMPRSDGSIDPDEERRKDLMKQLRKLGGKAVPALRVASGDPDPDVRWACTKAIEKIQEK